MTSSERGVLASPEVSKRPSFGAIVADLTRELVWSFNHPRPWLEGVAFNLVLSVLYLVVEPFGDARHSAWVILVGSYFATFVLADVTTTNILGHDRIRSRRLLAAGASVRYLILRRNFVLLVVVGVPVVVATAILTERSTNGGRLAITMPGVLFPILVWIGLGNVISVLLPVAWVPLRVRWRLRQHRGWIARWLFHLGLPYALYYALDPVDRWPLLGLRRLHSSDPIRTDVRGFVITAAGIAFWLGGTWIAVRIVRRRGLVIF